MGESSTHAHPQGKRRWVRLFVRLLLAVTALIVAAVAIFLTIVLVPTIRDPSPGFVVRKGQIAESRETATWTIGDDVLTEVTLTSTSGLEVELTVRVPSDATSPRPLIILLAGKGTGRDAVRYTAETRGVVVAALSYPYRGDEDAGTLALVLDLPAIQKALLDTIPAIMLAVDWLTAQPYVDPDRVELVGGSFGAFLVSVPGAIDERFRRVWLVHGGGQPTLVLEHGLREHIRFAPARRVAAMLLGAAAYSHHLAPEKWVGKISPRPVIVISALDDESIPRESVETLHSALGQPSEVIWMSGGHVMPDREEIIEQITDVVFTRVIEENSHLPVPDGGSSVLTPCQAPGVDGEALCGQIRVLENRAAQEGRSIDLRVVVLPSRRRSADEPVFFLQGGPGAASSEMAAALSRSPLREQHDLVLVDQRGTGGSNPLRCGPDDPFQGLDVIFTGKTTGDLESCREKMDADLRYYTSVEAMSDLDEVRAALGHDRINLWGASYGSLEAFEYVRRHPERVRALAIQGVAPPALFASMSVARSAQRALDATLEACRQDADCSAAFPDVQGELKSVLAKLSKNPV